MTTPVAGLPIPADAWLLASNNAHKAEEIAQLLAPTGVVICRPRDLNVTLEVEEWGTQFATNAAIKAIAFAQHTGRVALADDSGLVVDALAGAPGVRSARYSGENATDQTNNQALVAALNALRIGQQAPYPTARFQCTIAVAWPAGGPLTDATPIADLAAVRGNGHFVLPDGMQLLIVSGALEGGVSVTAAGTDGFGYDPHFVLPDGRHLAELSPADKNAISHRGQALAALLDALG